jgi:NSS family neurotransmitter:Na+ symporter
MGNNTASVTWKNRWIFILAATGSAVGLGNIWKFPYITGEYGGGAFVLVYLACILLIGIPVMIAEVTLGRSARTDPVDAVLKHAKENNRSPWWAMIGGAGVVSGLMIMMFYSVVAGWIMDYLFQSLTASYAGQDAETIGASFGLLYTDHDRQLLWHSLFCLLTAGVVGSGVQKGIGNAVEILMPLLFVMMLVMLGYSIAAGDFKSALYFMFNPDFSKLTGEAVLEAMGHSFFTLSLGMGSIMAYGAYMPGNASIGKTVLTVGFFDTALALIAGLIIFPLVFANNMEPAQSVGLIFNTLPIVFSQMPFGMFFASIFFGLVTIAALSSSISLIEPGVAWLEKHGVERHAGTLLLAGIAWAGGILCLNIESFFGFLDDLTTKYSLPIGGLLIAIFVGWSLPKQKVRLNFEIRSGWIYQGWYWSLRVLAPLGILIVIINQLELFS